MDGAESTAPSPPLDVDLNQLLQVIHTQVRASAQRDEQLKVKLSLGDFFVWPTTSTSSFASTHPSYPSSCQAYRRRSTDLVVVGHPGRFYSMEWGLGRLLSLPATCNSAFAHSYVRLSTDAGRGSSPFHPWRHHIYSRHFGRWGGQGRTQEVHPSPALPALGPHCWPSTQWKLGERCQVDLPEAQASWKALYACRSWRQQRTQPQKHLTKAWRQREEVPKLWSFGTHQEPMPSSGSQVFCLPPDRSFFVHVSFFWQEDGRCAETSTDDIVSWQPYRPPLGFGNTTYTNRAYPWLFVECNQTTW